MDPERWQVVQRIFHQAVELPATQRAPFVEAACRSEATLAAEVNALLSEDERESVLDQPNLAHIAAATLAKGSLPAVAFGPYKITGLLGEGGMAVVYLAVREDLGSLAAIKVLRDAWMSPARRDRFALEQRTLAQLSHPSIARLYDADTLADGTPWFAMECVQDAIPLTQYCRERKSTVEQKLLLLKSVCEAVQYAHSCAIIHRDLKPSNIVVHPNGSIKLLDFGIAKHISPAHSAAAHDTITTLRMMTPAYAAPEQITGAQVGTYTDVYALGVILYELLTTHVPFDFSHPSSAEAELAILNKEAEKPSLQARKTMPKAPWADLDVICIKALHKEPARRYQSVEALMRDIDHCLKAEPLEARPDTVGYRAIKFARRNRRPLAISTFILACLAGVIVFYTARLASARNAALAEAARTQRILSFTLNLFNGGDLSVGPAGDLRVTALINRGAREAANLNRDPAVQAEMYETLGKVYHKLGVLDRAGSLLSQALEQRQKLFGSNNESVARNLVSLGLLRSSQARFPEAEQLVRHGLDISRAVLPGGHPDIAAATHALGLVLEDRGAYDNAAKSFGEAVTLRSASGADPADLAASRFELANTCFYLGKYDDAESLYRQLLPVYRRLFGEMHPTVAEDLINIGAIRQERGQYQEAEKYHRQALDIMQSFYGNDHYKTAHSLTLVARAVEYQGRYAEATDMLQRALIINRHVFGAVHPGVASTLNELGNIAVRQGRYSEAEANFTSMLDIYRSCYHGKHYLIGIALANLGGVFMARKDNAHAEQLYRQALAMYAQTLPPNSLNEGITRIKLGRALLRQNRAPEAYSQTLAGSQIVARLQSPTVSYLQNAKQDLTEERRLLANSVR